MWMIEKYAIEMCANGAFEIRNACVYCVCCDWKNANNNWGYNCWAKYGNYVGPVQHIAISGTLVSVVCWIRLSVVPMKETDRAAQYKMGNRVYMSQATLAEMEIHQAREREKEKTYKRENVPTKVILFWYLLMFR